MTIVDFLKKYSPLPTNFIEDFATIVYTDDHYDTTRSNIDFELIV